MKIKMYNEKEFNNKEMKNILEGISELHRFYKSKIGNKKVSDIINDNIYEYEVLDGEYIRMQVSDIEIWGNINQQNERPSVSILVEGEEDMIHIELKCSENKEIEINIEG